jgi:RHS repeat-associated protein
MPALRVDPMMTMTPMMMSQSCKAISAIAETPAVCGMNRRDASVGAWYSNIIADGAAVGQVAAGGNIVYNALDALGSTAETVNAGNGQVTPMRYYPYGEIENDNSAEYMWTNQIRDVNGNDHFWFRNYAAPLARWLKPDPLNLGAVDPTDPQSWNLYAYVRNNPLEMFDPLGLDGCVPVSPGENGTPGLCPPGQIWQMDGNPGGAPTVITIVVCSAGPGCSSEAYQQYYSTELGMLGDYSAFDFALPIPSHPTGGGSGTPWYHNSCITGALSSGAVSVGIDALGFLPEAGGVARVVGHQAGYVGKVTDNVGKNMLTAGTKTTGFLSSATGFSSSDWTTWVSAGITATDFVPVLSYFTTPAAIIWDAGVAAYKVYQCPK